MNVDLQRTYLTQETELTALLRMMEADASYRPGGYEPGEAGLTAARVALADMRELLKGLHSEGDD